MTEPERLEEELRTVREELARALDSRTAAEAMLAAFMRHAPLGVVIMDRDFRILTASPRWMSQLRLSQVQVLGRSLYHVLPSIEDEHPLHVRCLDGENFFGDEVSVVGPDGQMHYQRLEMAPWRDWRGNIAGVVLIVDDVTDVVAARTAARRSEHRLTLALEIFESVVWEMSFRDRRLFATGAVSSIYDDVPTFKAFSEDLFVAVHPEDQPRVRAAWDAHIERQRPFRTEYRINRRDRAEIWVDAAAETLRDENGAPERVIGVLKNITDRKQTQLAVAQAREAAEAANRAKSEFLANMSHEIRTPLNGVMGVAGVLARTELSAEQRQMVQLIESSAHTLERLLTDILDLARIEAGRFEIKDEAFDLAEMLRGVCALFEPRARDKGVAFELHLDAGCERRFNGDVVRLRQILANLLSNAVKFTDHGAVRLRVHSEQEPGSDRTRLRFVVEDTGIGFDAAATPRLFERFQQADGSITRQYGGSGLGLAISRSLAERMGGHLEAYSQPGRGAVFTLGLTLAVTSAAPDAVQTEIDMDDHPAAAGPRPPRILLAEDHPTNRKVVELILGATRVDLVSVENGAEALQAACEQPFDLILMDMQMPVMDGLSAIREIRKRERTHGLERTPILALTANAMPEHARASRLAGADGHVTKPVSAKVLLDAVAEAIADKPSEDAAARSV